MRSARSLVAIVWLAFAARGIYYCVQQPLWEGLDEWAHFAALDYFASHGRMPAPGEWISPEIVRSLELAPLPWSNNGWIPGAVNHDEFWQLPAAEREVRRAGLNHPAGPLRMPQTQYEGQQPPLYYALLALPYRAARSWPLPVRVLWIRMLSFLLASASIPLAYLIAREIPLARPAALPVAAFLAAMPSVVLFLARIANDALATPLIAATVWTLLRALRSNTGVREWFIAGLALGAALLTKGYALALAPVFLVTAVWGGRPRPRRTPRSGFTPTVARAGEGAGRGPGGPPHLALAVAIAVAGWWYLRTLLVTGTLAGDQLGVAAAATQMPLWRAAFHIDWLRALDAGAMTHVWIGGWSFLQLRSWMYRVFELLAVAGAIGLVLVAARILKHARTMALLAVWVLVMFASAFFTLNIYRGTHVSGGVGWYAIAFSGVEATLLATGLAGVVGLRRARLAMAVVAALALVLDLYTVHFALVPYYAGLIRHRSTGAIEAFHPLTQGVAPAEMFHRLNWTGLPLAAPAWVLYLIANAALAWIILWLSRNPPPAPAHPPSHAPPAH